MTAGPDGNLWFSEPDFGRIGRITPDGVLDEFRPHHAPLGITAGPDGALWYTETTGVGQITTAGGITEYPLLGDVNSSLGLGGIVTGPDGNLWLTASSGLVWRVSTSGKSVAFGGPADGGIALGADGNFWFTGAISSSTLARLTPSGAVMQYAVPTAGSLKGGVQGGSVVGGITAGPDGNIWFVEPAGNKVAKVILATVPDVDPGWEPAPLSGSRVGQARGLRRPLRPPLLNFTTGPFAETDPGTLR